MSTDTPTTDDGETADAASLRARVDELEEALADLEAEAGDDQQKMTIIATKGTLDMAYPPLILASTAAAFGWDVVIFNTFWGLEMLHKEKSDNLKLSAVGNPNLPMPNLLASLPFMDTMATKMMERKIAQNNTASIADLIDVCVESGVELQACQMTQDLMGYEDEDFIEGVTTGVGAATAIEHMAEADIQLLV